MFRSRTWTQALAAAKTQVLLPFSLPVLPATAALSTACKTGPDLSTDYGQTARENFDLAVGEFEDRDWDETIAYADYVKFNGESGAKENGKARQEGKDYVVQDGDVMHFRFNV